MKLPLPLVLAACIQTALVAKPHFFPVPEDIPYLGNDFQPSQQEGVFAVSSKQGMRILVSRDDGLTWEQTFLGTESREDGGWHGHFAVYGMAYTEGMIGVFSGWGTPGVHIGSDDGVNWGHMLAEPTELASVWGAAAGNGAFITSNAKWGDSIMISEEFKAWRGQPVLDFVQRDVTHHMISGFGDYAGGTFIVVGDFGHAFYSHDSGNSWNHSRLPDGLPEKGQGSIVYKDGVFLVSFQDYVVRSEDGGETWTKHEHGVSGRLSWRGLNVVNDWFWISSRGGKTVRASQDGIEWRDLPDGLPGGMIIPSEETGTLINVERGRPDIWRSTDKGRTWDVVLETPEFDPRVPIKERKVTWDLALGVWGKVKRP